MRKELKPNECVNECTDCGRNYLIESPGYLLICAICEIYKQIADKKVHITTIEGFNGNKPMLVQV